MKGEIMISIADFSTYPSGRDAQDGTYNGERYRNEILVPLLQDAQEQGKVLCVSLKGVLSFGSSFLEEAFGGLIRTGKFDKDQLKKLLKIDPGKPSFTRHEKAIWNYIKEAK